MARLKFNQLALDTFGRLAGVRAYIDMLERGSPEFEAKERQALEELASSEGWEFADYDVERQVLDERFTHWMPRFSAYSALILLNSVFEVQLVECARYVGMMKQSSFDIEDLRGRGVNRATMFIRRVTGHDPRLQEQWQELVSLGKIRNLIVHRIGTRSASGAEEPMIEDLQKRYPADLKFPKVRSWAYSEAWVSFPLCHRFADSVEAFFKELFTQLGMPTKGIEVSS